MWGDYKYMSSHFFVFVTGRQTAAWNKTPHTPIPSAMRKGGAGGCGGDRCGGGSGCGSKYLCVYALL